MHVPYVLFLHLGMPTYLFSLGMECNESSAFYTNSIKNSKNAEITKQRQKRNQLMHAFWQPGSYCLYPDACVVLKGPKILMAAQMV
jgi:hypothetical protein